MSVYIEIEGVWKIEVCNSILGDILVTTNDDDSDVTCVRMPNEKAIEFARALLAAAGDDAERPSVDETAK